MAGTLHESSYAPALHRPLHRASLLALLPSLPAFHPIKLATARPGSYVQPVPIDRDTSPSLPLVPEQPSPIKRRLTGLYGLLVGVLLAAAGTWYWSHRAVPVMEDTGVIHETR